MAARRLPLNQTEIPVPSQAGRVIAELTEEDREREYARLMGEEALARQKALAEQERTCSCGKGAVPIRLHAVGCKARPLTRSGNAR
jgi:hypothetical protein